MKYRYLWIYLVFPVLLGLNACSPQKRMLRQAGEFEQLGLDEDAFDKYSSIYTTYQNPEALAAMKRLAQQRSDYNFAQARMASQSGYYESALTQFEAAFAYYNSKTKLGITLPMGVAEQQQTARIALLEKYGNEAESLMLEERYDEAHVLISKMTALERNNERARFLSDMCDMMPAYKSGVKAMELGLYRQAWNFFNEVTQRDASFRDALQLKRECAQMAGFTVAYLPVNADRKPALSAITSAAVKRELLDLKDPFMQVVSRDNLDEVLREQQAGMSGLYDSNKLAEAGKLLGADFLITGEFVTNSLMLTVAFKYELISTETGRVYKSDSISLSGVNDQQKIASLVSMKLAQAMRGFNP